MRIAAAAVVLLSLGACSPSLARPSGLWRAAAPRPVPEFGTQFVSLPGDRVLAVGGAPRPGGPEGGGGAVYDAAGDRWSGAAPLPDGASDPAVVPLPSGGVLVAGGADARGSALRAVYLYDSRHDVWNRRADLQVARAAAGAILLDDGRVLVLGGAAGSIQQPTAPAAVAAVEVYDPGADAWTSLPDLPMGAATRPSAVVLPDGRVLVAGGSRRGTPLDAVGLLDPSRRSWSTLAKLPQPRFDGVFQLRSGRAVLIGGSALVAEPGTGGFAINPALDAELLDLRTFSWSLGSPPTSQQANNFLLAWSGIAPLRDGRTLAVGFSSGGRGAVSVAFTYDSDVDFWQVAGRVPLFEFDLNLVPLSDGRVLAVGSQSAWLYDPTRSAVVPASSAGWLDDQSTTVVLLVVGAAIALVAGWRRLS